MLKQYSQWIAAFGVYTLVVQVGIVIGWASPNITRFTAEDSEVPMTKDEASWLVSFMTLGGIAGSIIGSVISEYVGSRKSVITAYIFIILGWGTMIFANSVIWIYFARVMGGIACLVAYTSFSIFLGEVTRSEIRGTLISMAASGNPLGVVVGTVAESYLPFRLTSSIYFATSLVGVSAMLYLLDSPYFLIKKNNREKARTSITMYYPTFDEEKKLVEIEEYMKNDETPRTLKDKIKEFKKPAVKKAFILVIVLFSLPHISGELAMLSYLETLLRAAKTSFIDPKQFVIIAHIIGITASFLTVNLIDKFGRRIMLMFSSVGITLSLGIFGLYLSVLHSGSDVQLPLWLPFAAVALYRVCHASGFLQIPSTVLGEILPENVKSFAVFCATLAGSSFAFFTALIYQKVVDLFGEEYILWLYGGLSLVAVPFVLIFLPETKGKSFAEIQELLRRK